MIRRLLFPLFVAGVLTAAVVSEVGTSTPATGADGRPEPAAAARKAASSSSLTGRAVKAADAFKASLTSAQRTKLQYSFSSSAKKKGWSNLPTSLVARNGVRIADMTTAQRAKLHTLLKTILSSQGLSDEEAVRFADTYLNSQQGNGGGGQGLQYGETLYYVAFFGTPSRSKRWTVQFGGHHLAIHMTFSGTTVSNTPYFIGVEPRTSFTRNGKTYQPLADEASALFGAVQKLSTAQKAKAKLSQSFDDVLVGPQKDGQFPTKQGITVSTLSAAQRKAVDKALQAYVGDMPSSVAKSRIATYRKQYSQTKLAYSKGTSASTQGDYVRLHGPRLWIEIVVQNGIVLSGTHYHSIERDRKTDYGAGT